MNNYQKGRGKEYRIMAKLKPNNEIVIRSAGSHSSVDVIAINKANRTILCVQSKPRSMSENAKQKLEKELEWLNGDFRVKFVVM